MNCIDSDDSTLIGHTDKRYPSSVMYVPAFSDGVQTVVSVPRLGSKFSGQFVSPDHPDWVTCLHTLTQCQITCVNNNVICTKHCQNYNSHTNITNISYTFFSANSSFWWINLNWNSGVGITHVHIQTSCECLVFRLRGGPQVLRISFSSFEISAT